MVSRQHPPGDAAGSAPSSASSLRAAGLLVVGMVVASVAAAVAGTLLTLLLRLVQHLTLGYVSGTFGEAFDAAPAWRRILGPTAGGVLAGLAWWQLRRRGPVPRLSSVISDRLPGAEKLRVLADAVVQIVIVGTGASIGREGAPRQAAATLADVMLGRWLVTHRRLLLAAAAGGGLAAVYTTPVAGGVFAVEIVVAQWSFGGLALSLVVSAAAVAMAWPITREAPTYLWPNPPVTWPQVLLPILVVVPATLVGLLFRAVTVGAARSALRRGPLLPLTVGLAGLALGVSACYVPSLPGNGKAVLQSIFRGDVVLTGLLAVLVLKPLVTAAFLWAGARGGLLTPAMATGGALGAAVAVSLGRPDTAATWALVGAASVLAISQRAPWFAACFAWELARPPIQLLVPLLVVALASHWAAVAVDRFVSRRQQPEAPQARP